MVKDIDAAIANRATVRIRIMAGNGRASLNGVVGIALGYNLQYHTVKFGFIDAEGKYTGEKTVIGFDYVELVEEVQETHEVIVSDDGGLSYRLFNLPEDCASDQLVKARAALKTKMEKAVKDRDAGAPEWVSTLFPKPRKTPRKSVERILKEYAGQVDYSEV